MSEYIVDVGDADELHFAAFVRRAEFYFGYPVREEIVRCRDCKHYGSYNGSWCCRTYEPVPGGTCDYQTVEPDGFCAWGERRGDAE